jgi:hypothetical protein
VLEAIIPDRVRTSLLPSTEVAAAADGMRTEWELVKQKWK